MTRESPLAAAYRAVRSALVVPGAVWGTRVYRSTAPEGVTRPYVVYFWSGGGETNRVLAQDATLVVTVKVVAESYAEAATGAAQIAERLNDQGRYRAATLDGGTDWHVLGCSQEELFEFDELFGGQVTLYHQGARFRLVMEAK
jgi:hypothetical protein